MRHLFAAPACWLALAAAACSVGCGSGGGATLPPLYPAKGAVTHAGRPIPEALVRFRPLQDDGGLIITGMTDSAGKFEMFTIDGGGELRKPGAPAGSYRATIDLPLTAEQSGGGAVDLAGPFAVQADKPEANDFRLETKATR